MATSSPFSLLNDLVDKFTKVHAPVWLIDEAQHRLVLLLNHVLMQEPEATARLARLQSRAVRLQWRNFSMTLAATPAGLLELATDSIVADLSLLIVDDSPLSLVQSIGWQTMCAGI
jgi:ubiquinone biosynthesis accessory factor UbiJ